MLISDVKIDHEYGGRIGWALKYRPNAGKAIVMVKDKTLGYFYVGKWVDTLPADARARAKIWVRGVRRLKDGTYVPCVINARSLTPLTARFISRVEQTWASEELRNMATAQREERQAIAECMLVTLHQRHVVFGGEMQNKVQEALVRNDPITTMFIKHLYDKGASMLRFEPTHPEER